MLERRLGNIRVTIRGQELDAILFTHLPNIFYLCGFSGSNGVLIVDGEESSFLTDSRYTTQARSEVAADHVGEYRIQAVGIVELLKERGCRKVGYEAEHLFCSQLEELRRQSDGAVDWVPLENELRPFRGIKDQAELENLRSAARLNVEAFAQVEGMIKEGMTERALALELEVALKRLGGEEKAFDYIVASGVRGAMPHGLASEKILGAGEMITIDFGVRWGRYHSDETVTLALGIPPERLKKAYDVVLKAHDLAIEGLRPGLPLKEVDALAREYIQGQGFGDFFGHGLGHGVGLEVHEYPVLSPRSKDIACEGMVVTIEPGIYIPQLGGVRIEDMVVVTPHGCEILTQIPKSYRSFFP